MEERLQRLEEQGRRRAVELSRAVAALEEQGRKHWRLGGEVERIMKEDRQRMEGRAVVLRKRE